jgi:hypothetical protein
MQLTPNEKEAANRAEVTALLIRKGYRVYRPEADCHGEDLILRTPDGELLAVQLKARPEVDWNRYGGKSLWVLFPDPKGASCSCYALTVCGGSRCVDGRTQRGGALKALR